MHRQSNNVSWRRLDSESRSTSFPAAISVHNPSARPDTHDRPLSSPPRDLAGRLKRKTTDIESSRIPVLTITMIKMHDVFEAFCGHLKDATFLNAQAACLALDSAEMKASENISDALMDYPVSPSRSPMSWFKSSYNPQSEIEWEKASAPLIVFAGLEAIYSSLSHLGSSHVQEFLVRLYRRTSSQLRLMKEALCDPFVYSTRKEISESPSTTSSYKTKAVALSLSIEAIMSLCECRCKLVEQHVQLCSSENFDAEKVAATFQHILHGLPKTVARSSPIVESVIQEVEGWCNLMATFCSFGKYRFMKTIVECQRTKMKLCARSVDNTCLQEWMLRVYQSYRSMLNIYFESSFCPTAGEKPRFEPPNLDIESKVEDFLRLEERASTSFAVAVVAKRAGGFRSVFKYGSSTSSKGQNIPEHTEDVLSAFPTLYIRTIGESSGKMLVTRRNSGKKDVDFDNDCAQEQNRSGDIHPVNSWPYMSWDNIVPLLKNNTPLSSDNDDSVGINWSQVDSETSICVTNLDHCIWLVAMKKTNDDSRWNRRKNDEERARKERELFLDLQNHLRLRDVFKLSLRAVCDDVDPILNELSNTVIGNRLLENENTSHLLESFKRIFGLRSPTRQITQLRHQGGTVSPKLLKGLDTWSSPLPSHFAFFLGGQLLESIGNHQS